MLIKFDYNALRTYYSTPLHVYNGVFLILSLSLNLCRRFLRDGFQLKLLRLRLWYTHLNLNNVPHITLVLFVVHGESLALVDALDKTRVRYFSLDQHDRGFVVCPGDHLTFQNFRDGRRGDLRRRRRHSGRGGNFRRRRGHVRSRG